ncbi:winged helix-turn-helix transcriptional regulator [Alloscardovia sp. HMSC034E08]|uniref:winged helix-turn-helix transcriptional regulator n=1 Tax=Alloscardovia sp. HMSC034E08 TaxID=1739413 RepID=UPI0008AB55EA|nr:helix-turn-helix domain-containing protein [Alloscardovia sp. HMSC034E08]OFQ99955.1 MarR family transcriptional regulator [Alloscardovia sp. HMSC034E08]
MSAVLLDAGLCPVATTIELIGGKWKILILRELLKGPQRYRDLKSNVRGVSQKMLTQSLREMEADNLIIRTVYAEVPPRVEYKLSSVGESMGTMIESMQQWGRSFLDSADDEYLQDRFGWSGK